MRLEVVLAPENKFFGLKIEKKYLKNAVFLKSGKFNIPNLSPLTHLPSLCLDLKIGNFYSKTLCYELPI